MDTPWPCRGEGLSERCDFIAITYTAAGENLASTIDKVCNDHEPVIITRKRNQSVVMISLGDYKKLEETAYLPGSPANAKRPISLLESIEKRELIKKKGIDLDS